MPRPPFLVALVPLAVGILFLDAGCRVSGTSASPLTAPSEKHEQDPVPSPAADLESGREVLDRHCGTCHRPGLLTSKPAALAVFSLADADWSVHMSDEQLCSAARRIHGSGRVEPEHATIFAGVVQRLLARRGSAPCPDLADPDSGADPPRR